LEKELNPQQFFRISRKFIISIKAIKDIVVYSNSRLKLSLNSYREDEVIVSRERVSEFKSWLG
jgi:two-component system, LytTR family, response regulator LytT